MEQVVIRRLKPGTLAPYRKAAKAKGRSLEAELREVIETHCPKRTKNSADLLRISDDALALTPPDGLGEASDSTLLIRWDRDTGGGRWIDDGWDDDAAGR
ncbi:MAG TPA: hypothetical protein VF589_10785 [Allosphingosinicella sp.]|jgi:plasmid stability protein